MESLQLFSQLFFHCLFFIFCYNMHIRLLAQRSELAIFCREFRTAFTVE